MGLFFLGFKLAPIVSGKYSFTGQYQEKSKMVVLVVDAGQDKYIYELDAADYSEK